MRIDLYVHSSEDDNKTILRQLGLLRTELQDFRRETMATLADFQAALAEVDAETTRIAARIQALIDQLSQTGISAADEEAALQSLRDAANRLKTVGTDVNNPVPNPIPPDDQV